jgi:hypothetical protein
VHFNRRKGFFFKKMANYSYSSAISYMCSNGVPRKKNGNFGSIYRFDRKRVLFLQLTGTKNEKTKTSTTPFYYLWSSAACLGFCSSHPSSFFATAYVSYKNVSL